MNTQGRQEEHHRLLDRYGFPSELEAEYARYTPVIEEDPSPFSHNYEPWLVNEAGQNLGERYYEDALTTPQLFGSTKRGVVEGGNSTETPISQLNDTDAFNNILSKVSNQNPTEQKISKSKEFFNWVEKSDPMVRVPHLVKQDCPCENCFQMNSNFKGTIEKANNNNPFAIATAQAKDEGHDDFSEGSDGANRRDEIAEAIKN